jgi:hypothetical protein
MAVTATRVWCSKIVPPEDMPTYRDAVRHRAESAGLCAFAYERRLVLKSTWLAAKGSGQRRLLAESKV